MTTSEERDALDARVLAVVRGLAPSRAYVKATVVFRRLGDAELTEDRVLRALDRLEASGSIARRRIGDGRRTKLREYVLVGEQG